MDSPRPAKRQRTASSGNLITPPATDQKPEANSLLTRAIHVLATEAAALASISHLYQANATAQEGLLAAVSAILDCQNAGGKLIVCGVGKSAYIGQKLVATCKSLGVGASFMHACEAAHGDLGDIRGIDVLLFVSFSGKTPELLNLLPHIPRSTRIMGMTSHMDHRDCALFAGRKDGILLPTPIPEKEETSFGVSAPTTSTTVALAVADMLALAVAGQMHEAKTKEVFKRNHPGGAIGMIHREVERLKNNNVKIEVLELPSPSISAESDDL